MCIANNEDHYIDEWVRYHLKLGFSEVFVFQNNWRYPEAGGYDDKRIHFIDFDGPLMMNPCYNGFIKEYHSEFDFAMFLDADEFLAINTKDSLNDILERYSDEDCIYVNWRIFGDNNLRYVKDGNYSCIKRFTMCDDKLHRLGKNILNFRKNGKRFSFFNPHIVLMDGKPFTYSDTVGNHKELIWEYYPTDIQIMELFHYRNKTYPEFFNRKFLKYDPLFGANQKINNDRLYILSSFDEFNTNKIENRIAYDMMFENKEMIP